MTVLLDSTVRVWLLVLLALAATRMLGGRSAALRHWVLAVSLVCAAAMPLLSVVAPEWRLPLSARPMVLAPSQSGPRPAASPSNARSREIITVVSGATRADAQSVRVGSALAAAWGAGAAAGVAILLVGLARLRQIASRARPLDGGRWPALTAMLAHEAGIRRPVAVLHSEHPTLLVTWGVVRPKIVLPVDAHEWSDDRARVVLRHELAHIARGDWLAQIVAELARALHWFNPMMWIACRELRRESELACDDAVLKGGVGAEDYAWHLVDLARAFSAHRRPFVPAAGMARPSDLERRITIMLSRRPDRTPLTRRARVATAVVLSIVALSVAGGRAQRFSTFSGTVTDQTNAVLPNIAVTVTNAAAQTRHEVRTDRTGHFTLPGLTDGDYQLAIGEPGFRPIEETFTITGGDVTRAIQLTVGDLHETISVTAGLAATPPNLELRQRARDYAAARTRKVAERCSGDSPLPGGNIGGNIMAPTKIVDKRAVYPEGAQPGVVTVEALIGTDGTVRDVRLVNGDPTLGAAAAEAVRQWEFTPTYLNCTAVEVRMGVTANFVTK